MDKAEAELVGAGLQQIRKLLGLTQEQVGDAMGVSASLVSWWENGRQELRLHEARRLAEFFDMPLGLFLQRLGYPVEHSGPTFPEWFRSRFNRAPAQVITAPTVAPTSARAPRGGDKVRPYAGESRRFAPALAVSF